MRTRIALVLLLLGGSALLPLPVALARSTADPAVSVAAGAITITGNGFGHGAGMSQYGAEGRAQAGLTAAQILAFYYPGTTTGTLTGRVRVWITGDADQNTRVRPASGLKVADLGSGRIYTLPSIRLHATSWRMLLVAGKVRLQYLSAGRWHPYSPAHKVALVGSGEFRTTGNLITLVVAGTNRIYRGAMRFTGGRSVNVLSIDQYLKGVIPAEMPAAWEAEALRAQAVAARTYAAFERADNADRSYQICDTSACQVYGGYSAETATTNAAVNATLGQIRTYQGLPAFTQFSASNGGWSAAGSEPYLVAKADPYDQAYRHWTKTLDVAALQRARPDLGSFTGAQVLSRDGNGEWGGRVVTIKLTYAGGSTTISGSTLRSWLGLRSDWFLLTN